MVTRGGSEGQFLVTGYWFSGQCSANLISAAEAAMGALGQRGTWETDDGNERSGTERVF